MNKTIREQLGKVTEADLSHYDEKTNSYFIPQKKSIKVEENNSYLIKLKPQAFHNETVKINWNSGKVPNDTFMKVNVLDKMNKMINVSGFGFDPINHLDRNTFWSGWLSTDDIEVLELYK